MVSIDSNKNIYMFNNDVSFRLGIDGLTNLVLSYFNEEEARKGIYIFFNKNCRSIKILEFESNGTWLYQNKLYDNRYSPPIIDGEKIQIDKKQLNIIFKNLIVIKHKRTKNK